MVNRIRSDRVLKLGEKIVNELGLDQTVDTLGRWMAHYIAEKIGNVEVATGEDCAQKMSECSDAILRLWAHRSTLPNGKQPFEDFEPIFRALQSLDPDDTTPRYFRQARSATNENDEDAQTTQWLSLAAGIDYTARILIRYCLTAAAQSAVDKSREWVALVETIAKEDDIDIKIVRVIIDNVDALNTEKLGDLKKEKIEDLLKRLDGFTHLASTLSSHLRQQLDRVTP